MKILQAIETSGPGGAEQMMLRMCGELRARGHRVEVLMLKEGWLADRVREADLPLTVIPMRSALDQRFRQALREHVRHRRPDVLHTHEFTLALYGRIADSAGGTPQVATVHGKNFTSGWKRRLLTALLLRRRARFALVAVSADLARHLRGATRLGQIRVVPNGVHVNADAAPLLRGSGEPFRLLSVGNLYPVKNQGLAIRCVGRLRDAGHAVELDILGRGGEEAALHELIRGLELEQSVRLHGFRDDVARFLSRSHALISTSLSEGMPVSFLEAMAAGVPVVSTRVGGVAELVRDGSTGLLFPSGCLEGAVAAVARLGEDEPLRQLLARTGLEQVRRHHSMRRTVDRYLELYAELGAHHALPVGCATPTPWNR